MLFDTSVWIDFSKNKVNPKSDLLHQQIVSGRQVFICPPIYQEVLQGIRSDEEYNDIKDLLMSLDFLQLDSYFVADRASQIYRTLRKKGLTVYRPNDCLIAFYAIHFRQPLVHNDGDFDKIATYFNLTTQST